MSSIMYINLVVGKANLRFDFLCNYNLSFTQTDPPLNCVTLEFLQDTDLSIITIAPHWSSSYPEYLSPHWDENTQRAVVWTRLQEHRKLANCSLAKVNERFLVLCQEQQMTQVKSSHEPSSCDIKLNLPMASRAEKVFKARLHLNWRGERNVPKKFIKAASFEKVGDETGYYAYHQGSYFPVEFDFTHCFWFIVKYNNQKSCWESYKLPTEDFGLNILDSEVTDRSEWGPIDDRHSDHSDEEDTKSEGHPESINIKIPTKEEETFER